MALQLLIRAKDELEMQLNYRALTLIKTKVWVLVARAMFLRIEIYLISPIARRIRKVPSNRGKSWSKLLHLEPRLKGSSKIILLMNSVIIQWSFQVFRLLVFQLGPKNWRVQWWRKLQIRISWSQIICRIATIRLLMKQWFLRQSEAFRRD